MLKVVVDGVDEFDLEVQSFEEQVYGGYALKLLLRLHAQLARAYNFAVL